MRYLILFMATVMLVFANAAKAGEEPELAPAVRSISPVLGDLLDWRRESAG